MRRALCALFFFALVNTAVGGEATPAKRVLMLSTGNRFSIGFPIVEQNAVDKLRQLRRSVLELADRYKIAIVGYSAAGTPAPAPSADAAEAASS